MTEEPIDPKKKNQLVTFKCSLADRDALNQASAKAGLTLSAWMRQVLLREAGVLG